MVSAEKRVWTMVESGQTVAVFGAYGHTGRFVVAELLDRGYVPLLVGRDEAKLQQFASAHPGLLTRAASVDESVALDRAFAGAATVINCAGPFAATGAPVIEAALRAGIAYVDVAAEIEANLDTFAFAERARAAGVAVVPAMAFYGGLGDLLTMAAIGDDGWTSVDEVHVAYGLSSWHPTAGTQAAGVVSHERRAGRRVRYTGGALSYYDPDGDLELRDGDVDRARRRSGSGDHSTDEQERRSAHGDLSQWTQRTMISIGTTRPRPAASATSVDRARRRCRFNACIHPPCSADSPACCFCSGSF